MRARRIGKPVIRSRRPVSLYRTMDGQSVYEFDVPAHAGYPSCGGLVSIQRHTDGRITIDISRVDGREVEVRLQHEDDSVTDVAPMPPQEQADACEGCGAAHARYVTLDDVHLCRRCYEAAPLANGGAK